MMRDKQKASENLIYKEKIITKEIKKSAHQVGPQGRGRKEKTLKQSLKENPNLDCFIHNHHYHQP